MKIICTEKEKKLLVNALSDSIHCPFSNQVYCTYEDNCEECVEKQIKWEVIETNISNS